MSKFTETNEKIAEKVVEGYKKIEDGVVSGYKKIEDGAVEGFNKVTDKIVGAVFAKTATADAIFSYVRARQNSISSANVEAMYRLVEDKVEALEFYVKESTSYTNIPFKELKTKKNALIACLGRNRQIIIPNGNDSIQVGDTVVIVTSSKKVQDITDILE